MSLQKFSEWPTPKRVRQFLICCIILFVIIYPIMMFLFSISYPVNFIESQLSFSGTILKAFHLTMSNEDFFLYTIANVLDYGFMVSYGGIFFCLGLIIARKFDIDSGWRKFGYILVIIAIIAPCCDAIENVFIFLMLTNPLGFPDIWALIHSYFALVKFILMFLEFGWVSIMLIKYLFNRISS